MTRSSLYPLRFEPMFQYRLWGGRSLGAFMGADLPGTDPIGEAWLLSDRIGRASRIANGPLAGRTLSDLMRTRRAELLGVQANRFDRFPLLLKFLDVRTMLSVQVHPRDDQTDLIPAGDTGKTEAWVVLRAEPGARIYAGLKPGTTAPDLRTLTAANIDDRLAGFRPYPGQAVEIQAGTVHSLGDGLMVFEIQENSDVTFRLYDWDHLDPKTGEPRTLQVDQALAAVDFERGAVAPIEAGRGGGGPARAEPLFHNQHFDLVRWRGAGVFPVGSPDAARILVCIDGTGDVQAGGHREPLARGEVLLMPAAIGIGRFTPRAAASVLEIAIPEGT